MFEIEISRTWYLFSGPVYVFVYHDLVSTSLCNYDLKFILAVEPNQVQNGTRWMAWSIHPFTSTVPVLDTSDYSDKVMWLFSILSA